MALRTISHAPNSSSREIKVVYVSIDTLKPYPGNAKIHSKKQLQQIADSIDALGFINPGLVDEDYMLLAGHGRYEAAKILGLTHIPVVVIRGLSEAQKRAYRIADNKIAENAEWNYDYLSIEFKLLIESDFVDHIELTGFEMPEIDIIIDGDGTIVEPGDTPVAIDPNKPSVSKLHDLWSLGRHSLICGDCRDSSVMTAIMQGDLAQMIFTDPPYNVPINGHVCGSGKIKHPEFAMASGEMSRAEFTAFLKAIFDILISHSVDGSIHYVCMDWRHLPELLDAGNEAGYEYKNLAVWVKSNAGMGSLYRSQHELVAVFKNGTDKHINNIDLGKYGRNRSNVWSYPSANSFGDGQKDLAMHPTVKPCELVVDAIKDCSKRGGIILDPFGGSGTSLIAAEKTGRIARLAEIEPRYVDVTIERWQALTGRKATLASTGQTYDDIKSQRALDTGGSNDR